MPSYRAVHTTVLWANGPGMQTLVQYTWFIGMLVALLVYRAIGRRSALAEPVAQIARRQ